MTNLWRKITQIYLTLQLRPVKKKITNCFNGLDLFIQMMKMEILTHELLHMSKKQVLMLNDCYSIKFILVVSTKTREIHFYKELLSRQSLLDLLLTPRVLNIVADLVLLVLLLPVMMVQEERRPMMVVTLEMMEGMLDNSSKVNNH